MLQYILNLIDFLGKRNTAFLRGEPLARIRVGQLQDQRRSFPECRKKTKVDPFLLTGEKNRVIVQVDYLLDQYNDPTRIPIISPT